MLLQLTVGTGSYREIKNGTQKGLKNQKFIIYREFTKNAMTKSTSNLKSIKS